MWQQASHLILRGLDRGSPTLWQGYAELVQHAAELVRLHHAKPDELLAYPMQGKHGLLILCSDSDEMHAGDALQSSAGPKLLSGVDIVLTYWYVPKFRPSTDEPTGQRCKPQFAEQFSAAKIVLVRTT